MRKILKGAVLLLITIALFLSTVAIADTNIKQTLSSSLYSIDIEKYVWDPVSQEWVDADIEYLALDLPICTDVEFKIIILNEGTETLYDIEVADQMGEKLKYISAVPAPDFFEYNPPFLDMRWDFPGPLDPGHYNQISILAHVEGPHGNTSYNVAITNALDLRSGCMGTCYSKE